MAAIEPEGKPLQRAVRWVDEQKRERPETPLASLVTAAGLRFDLSPKDQQLLARLCGQK